MANTKEAIGIVLDVGPSMNHGPPGEVTALQTSITAINMILQRKMFSESKDEICLILFGTPDTANDLAEDDSYKNITVARPLGTVDWDLLNYVLNDVQPSDTSADFVDAIVVAMDAIVKGIQGKRGFGSKRIVLFSDLAGEFGNDQLDDILGSFKEQNIEFNLIGPDLDNDEDDDGDSARPGTSNGVGKEKTPQQRAGEDLCRQVIEKVEGGASYSFNEALPALSYFQSRQVRSMAWKCQLTIGSELAIPIAAYHRIREAKAKSFKNVYAKDPDAALQRERSYHLNDEEETEIEKSDVVDGHRYGSTLVPFSEDDKEAFKYASEKCLKVLGFTKSENIKRHHFLGDFTMAVVAEKDDSAAQVALSSFIKALYETNMCAVVRRVYAANAGIKLGCLVPHIKADHECLFYNELPFAEDLRTYQFGSLPTKEANTGPNNKKLAPTDEQLKLIDGLIDDMDLMKADGDGDDDEDAEEALKPKLLFNPYLQRLYQCLQHRALHPEDPLPELSALIASYLEPPKAVEVKCEARQEEIKEKFKLTVVEKKKDEKTGEKLFKDDGDGDAPAAKKAKVDDDLGGGLPDLVKGKVTEVGTVNPVEDFKALIGQKDEDKFEEACKMMQKVILQIILDSFGNQSYGKAMDCLKALRAEAIKNSEPGVFNDFLRESKESLANKGKKDFWDEVIKEKVGLISKAECEESKLSKAEADAFLETKEETKEESKEADEDVDDLMDEL